MRSLTLALALTVGLLNVAVWRTPAPLAAHGIGTAIGRLQDVQEPPEFPPGEFCTMDDQSGTPPAHPCACRAMDDCSKPAEGQGQGPTENKQCAQWCHKDHCHCAKKCP
jgi:hypothetical protein